MLYVVLNVLRWVAFGGMCLMGIFAIVAMIGVFVISKAFENLDGA